MITTDIEKLRAYKAWMVKFVHCKRQNKILAQKNKAIEKEKLYLLADLANLKHRMNIEMDGAIKRNTKLWAETVAVYATLYNKTSSLDVKVEDFTMLYEFFLQNLQSRTGYSVITTTVGTKVADLDNNEYILSDTEEGSTEVTDVLECGYKIHTEVIKKMKIKAK